MCFISRFRLIATKAPIPQRQVASVPGSGVAVEEFAVQSTADPKGLVTLASGALDEKVAAPLVLANLAKSETTPLAAVVT